MGKSSLKRKGFDVMWQQMRQKPAYACDNSAKHKLFFFFLSISSRRLPLALDRAAVCGLRLHFLFCFELRRNVSFLLALHADICCVHHEGSAGGRAIFQLYLICALCFIFSSTLLSCRVRTDNLIGHLIKKPPSNWWKAERGGGCIRGGSRTQDRSGLSPAVLCAGARAVVVGRRCSISSY